MRYKPTIFIWRLVALETKLKNKYGAFENRIRNEDSPKSEALETSHLHAKNAR